MTHKRLLIGSSFALLALIFGLTVEQKFSRPAATVLAAERSTTMPTLPPTGGCELGGVKITALNRTEGVGHEKIEVAWDFTMPQNLCATVDDFFVEVDLTFRNGNRKVHVQKASPLARNAIFIFSDVLRDVKGVFTIVRAEYKFNSTSQAELAKDY
jgi:hypothetical protein